MGIRWASFFSLKVTWPSGLRSRGACSSPILNALRRRCSFLIGLHKRYIYTKRGMLDVITSVFAAFCTSPLLPSGG